MSERFLEEPIELTDAELDAVAGGFGQSPKAQEDFHEQSEGKEGGVLSNGSHKSPEAG
jgi:hypothetical protein